jgi:hypothetical protein
MKTLCVPAFVTLMLVSAVMPLSRRSSGLSASYWPTARNYASTATRLVDRSDGGYFLGILTVIQVIDLGMSLDQ